MYTKRRSETDRELNVDQLLDKKGMPKDLGVEFQRLLPDRAVATMPVDDRHLQPLGVLHGEVSLTLAESVATVGAWLNCPSGKAAVGATINADHLTLKPRRPSHRLRHARLHRPRETDLENRDSRRERQESVHVPLHAERGRLRLSVHG
jgi:uncharacterized protein (TIGR00369 family)